jgi:hypothetical protein
VLASYIPSILFIHLFQHLVLFAPHYYMHLFFCMAKYLLKNCSKLPLSSGTSPLTFPFRFLIPQPKDSDAPTIWLRRS